MQNIFIVPAMQHGCCAKPLHSLSLHVAETGISSGLMDHLVHMQNLPYLT